VWVSEGSKLAYVWAARYSEEGIALDRQFPPESSSGIPVRVTVRCRGTVTVVETDWQADGSVDDRMSLEMIPHSNYVKMEIDTNGDGQIDEYMRGARDRDLFAVSVTALSGRVLYLFSARESGSREVHEMWLDDRVHSERMYLKAVRAPNGPLRMRETKTEHADGTTELRRWSFDERGALQSSTAIDPQGTAERVRCRFQPPCAKKFSECEHLCSDQESTHEQSR
jgi:hypothetical protein